MSRSIVRRSLRLIHKTTTIVDWNPTFFPQKTATGSLGGSIRKVSDGLTRHNLGSKEGKPQYHSFHANPRVSKAKTNSDHIKNPVKSRHHGGHPTCQIFQNDFDAFLQSVDGRRFKVHKPGCHCTKVKSIRERSSRIDSHNTMHGFVVVPDSNSRFVKSIYLHPLSDALQNGHHGSVLLSKELELKKVIFRPDSSTHLGINVSCAACLLEQVPNGFVCINSTIKSVVDGARDEARKNAQNLLENGTRLHADHAEEVVVLCSKYLRPMARFRNSTINRIGQTSIDRDSLKEQLVKEGLNVGEHETIVLGHHIKSFLLTWKKDCYLLAIVFRVESHHDGLISIQLDLPGGKRRPGESSFDCAIRETMEETSLLVDTTWLVGDGQPLKSSRKGGVCNVFYDLHPPGQGTDQDEVQHVVDSLSQIQV
jgi:hypothetical protein